MTEKQEPDFEQIVRELRKYFIDDGSDREAAQNALLDQILRQAWNARGAADAAKIKALMTADDDGTGNLGSLISLELFDRAIKALDR